MKKLTTFLGLLTLIVAGLVSGSALANRFSDKASSQNNISSDFKQTPVWVREEIPVTLLGSDFVVNIENFASKNDLIIGVKKVPKGEATKIYAGAVDWKNRSDADSIKMKSGVSDLKAISSVENCKYDFSGNTVNLYSPQNNSSKNNSYIVYAEIADDASIKFKRDSAELLNFNETGIYYNGQFEAFNLVDPTQLLLELNLKKTVEKYKKAGLKVKVNRQEGKNDK